MVEAIHREGMGVIFDGVYTHVADAELVSFLADHDDALPGPKRWDLIHAVETIDSNHVRGLLRRLAARAVTRISSLLYHFAEEPP